MKTTTSAPDWTKARAKPESDVGGAGRAENIFAGSVTYSMSVIAGVPIVRIAVNPTKNERAPLSYAVEVNAVSDWQDVPFTTQPSLPYPLQWQQSKEARWDFFFPLPLSVHCLGLGERFSGINLRGAVHTLCTTDQPHHNEEADSLYKAIPFIILAENNGNSCHGIFIDSPAPQIWDLDAELAEVGQVKLLSRRGWTLYMMGSGSLPEIVGAFTQLTGRTPMPPLWALGHQQCRWSYADEETVLSVAHEFRDRNIACDTVVLDIDYMDEYRVFTHSATRFPHFSKLSDALGQMNLKIITIVDPGIKKDPQYAIYSESIANDLVCRKANGKPFTDEVWPGVCVFPDFLKEETRKWWGDKLRFYIDSGIAGIWNDMNEPAFFGQRHPITTGMDELPPTEEQRFLQSGPEGPVGHLEVRNVYGQLMSQATHAALKKFRPGERPFVLTRSAYAGIQKYSAVWLGDNMSWYEHLRKSIPMLLNIGMSGVPFAGVDVGGFAGNCSAELLIRWYELGIFYPFFRNHCRMGDRAQEPWSFGALVLRTAGGRENSQADCSTLSIASLHLFVVFRAYSNGCTTAASPGMALS
jgi:alpha-glucosidase